MVDTVPEQLPFQGFKKKMCVRGYAQTTTGQLPLEDEHILPGSKYLLH